MKDYGVELIPRKTLFGNPERTAVTLSHDGTRVAYLAPLDGVLNVWVAPVDAIGEAKPVTRDRGRGIRHYLWSYHPGCLLYGQDRDGDENWHVHAVEIDTGRTRDLTPYDGVRRVGAIHDDRTRGRRDDRSAPLRCDRQIPVPARQPRPGHGGARGPGHGDRRSGNAGIGREGGCLPNDQSSG
jgi:hypothetical protein